MTVRRASKLGVGSDRHTLDVIELEELRADDGAIARSLFNGTEAAAADVDEYASSVRLSEREARELTAILRRVIGDIGETRFAQVLGEK